MVGILDSFWDGPISGAMLVSGRVPYHFIIHTPHAKMDQMGAITPKSRKANPEAYPNHVESRDVCDDDLKKRNQGETVDNIEIWEAW